MKVQCSTDKIKSLSADGLKHIFETDKQGEYLLLDVRQPEEYVQGHIPGALLIPLGELEARQQELNRSRKIITYCRAGHRSMSAAILLCNLGFTDLHHLSGGFLAWKHEKLTGMPPAIPELISEVSDIRALLLMAIRLERGSHEFYINAERSAQSPALRGIFGKLAAAEIIHMEKLYERANSMTGIEKLPPLEHIMQEVKPVFMEGGLQIKPQPDGLDKEVTSEMDALESAIENEYISYDFYMRSSTLVADSAARTLLGELAFEERAHAGLLLQYLAEIVKKR